MTVRELIELVATQTPIKLDSEVCVLDECGMPMRVESVEISETRFTLLLNNGSES